MNFLSILMMSRINITVTPTTKTNRYGKSPKNNKNIRQ